MQIWAANLKIFSLSSKTPTKQKKTRRSQHPARIFTKKIPHSLCARDERDCRKNQYGDHRIALKMRVVRPYRFAQYPYKFDF